MRRARLQRVFLVGLLLGMWSGVAHAAGGEAGGQHTASVFLWIALLLVAARVGGLVERLRQPPVLGELAVGILLGNLSLVGFHFFEAVRSDTIVQFLAELGVVILLFQIGLESNLREMIRVGPRAFGVAVVGVVVPFVLAVLTSPFLLPGAPLNTLLFVGAALTATSVGITARVFHDLHALQRPEARIVLGAAVIDDVLGLIVLAVVSAIATSGSVRPLDVAVITAKAFVFLVGAIVLGSLLAPYLSRLFSRIQTGRGMKFTLAISFCLVFAALAERIGLAPIVGAFAAGLVLEPVHFRHFADAPMVAELKAVVQETNGAIRDRLLHIVNHHAERHVEELVEPVGFLLVPLFFVVTGMTVRLETLFDLSALFLALVITAIAFVGKLVSGLVAGPEANKWAVGWGMAPRGEVGLIVATIGHSAGVVSDELFSVIVIMVILTTLLSPPFLAFSLRRSQQETPAAVHEPG